MMILMIMKSFSMWALELEKDPCQKINKFMEISMKHMSKNQKWVSNQKITQNQLIVISNQVLQLRTMQHNVMSIFHNKSQRKKLRLLKLLNKTNNNKPQWLANLICNHFWKNINKMNNFNKLINKKSNNLKVHFVCTLK